MVDETGSMDVGNPGGDAGAGEGATQQAASNQGSWHETLPEEMRGIVENKGWQSPQDAVQSYANLEKMLGADKAGRGLVMPKEDAGQEEWSQFYDRLGRPQSPDEYQLPVPENDTGEFASAAKAKFHELGITAKQAEQLAEWWNGQSSEMQQQQIAQTEQQAEQQMEQLKKEWGQTYDENIEAARRASRQFGLGEETLSKIEGALGTGEMLKMFANIGKGLGEDAFVDNQKSSSFGMSPEAARVRLNQLKNDPDWSSKYLQGNADAKAEMERLMQAAYPS